MQELFSLGSYRVIADQTALLHTSARITLRGNLLFTAKE